MYEFLAHEVRLLSIQQSLDTQTIRVETKTCDSTHAGSTNKRCVAELLTSRHIRDVYLHHGYRYCGNGITQRYRGVGVTSGIEQYAIVLLLRLVKCIYQLTLDIRLCVIDSVRRVEVAKSWDKDLKRLRTIYLSISPPLQIEVRTVQD